MKLLSPLLFSLFVLLACDSQNNNNTNPAAVSDSNKFQHSILSFGTIIDVTVIGVDASQAQQAFTILEEDFKYWHRVWNPWLKGPLSRVNSLIPTKAAFNLPLHLIPLIEQSQGYYQQSEGLFNPAIGQLINLWRFHEHKQAHKQPPDEQQIQALISARPTMQQLHLQNIQLQSENENVLLNFGAFAKGYAIERSIKTLQNLGIENAVINAGGDLKVLGQHHDRAWRIGIRHPRDKSAMLASVQASDHESVFTSGDYERYFIFNDKRYNHILDPRTGYPADLSQSVTVIHADAGRADAAATALFVAGPEHWHRIAKKMGIKFVLLVAANGEVHMNPAMAKRIQLNLPDAASVKISDTL
ncbi:MAG: FAD:protein FMN transferase [Gammaproteobacteria bacterium]|nr:FAD:protein FMN transferase [Gammaproteobacteria bacterium]